jgi:hypothetical protein
MGSDSPVNASFAGIESSSNLGSSLLDLLMCDEIVPGAAPSYQTCKTILLYHPLGAKMAEAPIKMAQSQPRTITVPGSPKEVVEEFLRVEAELKCQQHILNFRRLSRVYGISSLVLGCVGKPSDAPLDMRKLWELPVFFNVFDPLNMSGSVIMNQLPNTPDFNQATRVVCFGQNYHRSRFRVAMNEDPIYISYTDSGFGFTGRSVYQRALFPLKSFVKTMVANDVIAGKIALIIAKMKAPGGVISKVMQAIAALKRKILKAATTGEVATIDVTEDIETLDMQNVDGAGTFARDNILKDCATAADMPAKLLQNETMIGGMAEGTEDAKNISKYIDGVRLDMKPDYDWCDNIVRYRAWMAPAFWTRIKELYPEAMAGLTHEAAFVDWCRKFSATWPSMLVEPPGEQAKGEAVKFEAMVAVVETLLPAVDPANKTEVVAWLCDNLSEIKTLLPHPLNLDLDALEAHFEEQKDQQNEQLKAAAEGAQGGEPRSNPAKRDSLANFRTALTRLPSRAVVSA